MKSSFLLLIMFFSLIISINKDINAELIDNKIVCTVLTFIGLSLTTLGICVNYKALNSPFRRGNSKELFNVYCSGISTGLGVSLSVFALLLYSTNFF